MRCQRLERSVDVDLEVSVCVDLETIRKRIGRAVAGITDLRGGG